MKIYKKIIQGSEEWKNIRSAKMTASFAQAIGSNGKGLETYIHTLMAEKYSSGEESYTNTDIERGNELEDQARSLYELQTGKTIEQVGFVEVDEFTGCSPDGIIEDGLIEIKCPNDKNHFELVINEKVDSKYIWQMQMQMLVCEKNWCDFISFNPNFERDLVIIRVERDEKKIEKLKEGFKTGKKLINELTKKYERTKVS